MSRNYLNKKEKIIDYCELPKDILLGASIISMMGNREISIDNFKKIIYFSSEKITLQCKNYNLEIKGRSLEISLFTKEEIHIYGLITEILFV